MKESLYLIWTAMKGFIVFVLSFLISIAVLAPIVGLLAIVLAIIGVLSPFIVIFIFGLLIAWVCIAIWDYGR